MKYPINRYSLLISSLLCFITLLTVPALAQSDFVDTTGESYAELTDPQKAVYDAIADDTTIVNIYMVEFDSLETSQDSGRLTISLPWTNKSADLVAKNVELHDSGYYWYGQVEFDSATIDTNTQYYEGYFSILKTGDRFTGEFSFHDEQYSIFPIDDEVHVVVEYDRSNLDISCFVEDSAAADMEDYYRAAYGGYRNSFSCPVRVLAIYTENAVDRMGSVQATETRIDLALRNTNSALISSKIASNEIRIDVRAIEFFDFDEDPNRNIVMDRNRLFADLADDQSILAQLRDANDADIIVLFTNGEYENRVIIDGITYTSQIFGIGGDFSLTDNSAAAIVEIHMANEQFTTAHEIGHLFNCRHDWEDNPVGPFEHPHNFKTGGGLFGPSATWRKTIMYTRSNGEGLRYGYYSNPRVSIRLVPTGTDTSDNARMINATGCAVAGFSEEDPDALHGYIKGPYTVCLNEDVLLEAEISGGAPGNYTFDWSYSYDGFTYTNLGINSDVVYIPGWYAPPTDPNEHTIFTRLVVTDQQSATITLNKTTLAAEHDIGQQNPCTHHGDGKWDGQLEDHLNVQDAQGEILIYPNPAQEMLNIEGSFFVGGAKAFITILSMQGKQMTLPTTLLGESNAISLRGLPPAMYVVEVRTDTRIYIQKFVKN